MPPDVSVTLEHDALRRTPAWGNYVSAILIVADLVAVTSRALDIEQVVPEDSVVSPSIPIGGDQHLNVKIGADINGIIMHIGLFGGAQVEDAGAIVAADIVSD